MGEKLEIISKAYLSLLQIVRDLAGYTLGRSDLVRRAMSKKKAAVMAKERQNFVYGNEEEGVPGCIRNGIDEATANKIFDEMTDFARYAFNKSHAAAYAVVSYQTAWLKYYYPLEYMAALMTSVIENPGKVAEYILTCRQMGISILPPDINKGDRTFSVDGDGIRYGLSAIKSVGGAVIDAIVSEREKNGPFTSLKNFVERAFDKDVNKRAVENFIKSGAFDSFGAKRRQLLMIYEQVMDSVNREKKTALSGQLSLFDFVSEEEKKEYEIQLPDVEEYEKEELLAFEKEVLGIYISGHPLEKYETQWRRQISAVTVDFMLDEESGRSKVEDGEKEIIGGMIAAKTVKYTKNNKMMAFLTLEDLVGNVEVVVFPRDYERYGHLLKTDAKIFVRGRVSAEEDRASKLISEKIWAFENGPKELWVQFADMDTFKKSETKLYSFLKDSDGKDPVIIYVRNPKAIRRLPEGWSVNADEALISKLSENFGGENVKVVEKSIENVRKMN